MSTYEAWRATHQDAESAAKAAFEQVQGLSKMVDDLQAALGRQVRFGSEAGNPASGAQDRLDRLYLALEVCSAELFAQCAHQGRAMKYVDQARYALAAEQCARAAQAKQGGAA